jgi:hypothetical protein
MSGKGDEWSKDNPCPRTLNRRSFLRWLGGSAVLTLGAGLSTACDHADGLFEGDGSMDRDGGTDGPLGDGRADGSSVDAWQPSDLCEGMEPEQFPFEPEPRDHEVYVGWWERTVDRQSLTQILDSWRLDVDGLVARPVRLRFQDLMCLARQDQITDLHCVEGWSVEDIPWNGIHYSELASLVDPLSTATHATLHCQTGVYTESVPLEILQEQRSLLAYGVAGSTLPVKHGFPLRLVIPRLYAYKSAKYIARIELTDHRVDGFWEQRGYSYDAEVPQGRLRPGRY